MSTLLRSSFRSLFVCLALISVSIGVAPLPGQQQPPQEEYKPRKREMPGRGIKGAGFAGLKPEEAKEAAELLAKGEALEKKGNLNGALHQYKRVYKRFPRSTSAPEAYYRTGKIFNQKDKPLKAFESFDAVVRAYPSYGKFNELIGEEYRIAYELIHGKRLKMFGVLPGFANIDRGIFFMERLVINAPYSDYAPLALMNVAEAYANAHQTDAAIDALDRLITNYPNSILAPDGYLRMGQIHEKTVEGPLYDQSATKEAINAYEDFLILFPRNPKVDTAEDGLARMKDMLAKSRLKIAEFYYLKRARYRAARAFYNEAITIAPNSESAQRARERIAQLDVDEAKRNAQIAEAAANPKKGLLGRIFGGGSGQATPTSAATPTVESELPREQPPVPGEAPTPEEPEPAVTAEP